MTLLSHNPYPALDSFPAEQSGRVKEFCRFQNRDNPDMPGIIYGLQPATSDNKIILEKYLDHIDFSAAVIIDSYQTKWVGWRSEFNSCSAL